MNERRPASLYVHVPFCAHKCGYCAFYSEAASGEVVNRYVEALCREMEMVSPDLDPNLRTVFFGGGTPSLLNLRQWERVLSTMDRLGLSTPAEWTVECNPATVSPDKAKLLRERGVNRVSMGVQSLDEQLLDRLGRVHSREMVFKSFDILRAAGFDNVNLDLMFAIPGQTAEVWQATLDETLTLGAEHLSSYEVIYEEDTPLYQQLRAGEFDVNEELACRMYDQLVDTAVNHGLTQYEIANFARGRPDAAGVPGLACRHNLNYWRGGEYHALGPAAAGFTNGRRTKNLANTVMYCERIEQGGRAIELNEALEPIARAGEIAAFGLRMNAGWSFAEFRETTGFNLEHDWPDAMDELVRREWAVRSEDRFQLNRAGLRFADAAAELFLVV